MTAPELLIRAVMDGINGTLRFGTAAVVVISPRLELFVEHHQFRLRRIRSFTLIAITAEEHDVDRSADVVLADIDAPRLEVNVERVAARLFAELTKRASGFKIAADSLQIPTPNQKDT